MRSTRPPKPPPSRFPLLGATPWLPPSLIESDLLRRLALLSPGDANGNLLLSNNFSLISALAGTTTSNGLPLHGVAARTHGAQCGESFSSTPRIRGNFCSASGGGAQQLRSVPRPAITTVAQAVPFQVQLVDEQAPLVLEGMICLKRVYSLTDTQANHYALGEWASCLNSASRQRRAVTLIAKQGCTEQP
jgi:hypothetical protein